MILHPYRLQIRASHRKPPMRYLGGASWDGGRPGQHNTARVRVHPSRGFMTKILTAHIGIGSRICGRHKL